MQNAELTYQPTFQDSPMVITGDYEAVESVNNDLEALEARLYAQSDKLASKAIKAVQTAPETPTELSGRRATIAAKLYDLRYGRNMADLLAQKRQDERDIAMATKLGLLSTTEVYCRKHQKVVNKLHGMVE